MEERGVILYNKVRNSRTDTTHTHEAVNQPTSAHDSNTQMNVG